MDNKIKVAVRLRPLNCNEISGGAEHVVNVTQNTHVVLNIPARQNTFGFDYAFNDKTSQDKVYESACAPLMAKFFDGFNVTIFAYGQTGSGKTYTMGTHNGDFQNGVVPSTVRDIFSFLQHQENAEVHVSYVEVYKEDIFDLLSNDKPKRDIRENQKGETVIDNLICKRVSSIEEVKALLQEVAKLRQTAKTAMNDTSSRSHAICTFHLKQNQASASIASKLHLVDLAGSERAKKTLASGDIFAEGVSINKGLLALGNVISTLASTTSTTTGHVPYRDSKITRLLKDSLGGNAVTLVIACVSTADTNIDETLNTLRFATRASAVTNTACINSTFEAVDNSALMEEISRLRTMVATLKSELSSSTSSSSASLPLLSFLRSVLIKCIEEDVAIDDVEIEAMRVVLQDITQQPPSTDDFLPSIMLLIDELEQFLSSKPDQKRLSTSSDTSSTFTSDEPEALPYRTTSSACDDDYHDSSVVAAKEQELAIMLQTTQQCKQTISQLRHQIQTLQSEKNTLSASTNANNDLKLKAVLIEKSKLLEEKQKELRKKEVEYAKIQMQREKACKEVSSLKKELEATKHKKVEIQKKLKLEADKFNQDRKQLQQSEIQSKRRELQMAEKVTKMAHEHSMKEKVLKGQLAEKDREIKRQKEILQKQSSVQLMKASKIQRRKSIDNIKPESALTTTKATELQDWLDREITAQTERNTLQEELKILMDARTKSSRKLQQLKQNRDQQTPLITCDVHVDIKTLEDEVRGLSLNIAKCQGALADLGSVVEKRRFSAVTDIKEAKYMFHKLTYDTLLQKRSYEHQLHQQVMMDGHSISNMFQEIAIENLKCQLRAYEANAAEHTAKRRRSLVALEPLELIEHEPTPPASPEPPSPMSEASVISNYDVDETFYPSDDEIKPKKRRSEQSTTTTATNNSKKSKTSVDGSEEPLLPLDKYTVAELKKFLAHRNCAVSGRKADLIARLQQALGVSMDDKENTENHDENRIASSIVAAGNNKHKLLSADNLLQLDGREVGI